MPEVRARLQIGSYGERGVPAVVQFLDEVEAAHDGLLTLLNVLDPNQEGLGQGPRSRGPDPILIRKLLKGASHPRGTIVARRNERLVITRVAISSPGIWEFLGALNPLVALNTFLEGKHERRKDREYREHADRGRLNVEIERMEIENQLLATQLVQDRLQVGRDLGLSPSDQVLLLERFGIDPLLRLGRVVDQGMAFPASALGEIEGREKSLDDVSDVAPLINPPQDDTERPQH